jgi:hypothetical protein
VQAFAQERYQSARTAVAEALTRLKAKEEMARPLVRFMGVPDPMLGAVGVALRAGILQSVGGPDNRDLKRLQQRSNIGVNIKLFIPKCGNNTGIRLLLRASNPGSVAGEIRVGRPPLEGIVSSKPTTQPSGMIKEFMGGHYVGFSIPPKTMDVDLTAIVPGDLGLRPGLAVEIRVLSTTSVRVDGMAIVPLSDEIPAPPPEPWKPTQDEANLVP